MVCTPFKTVDGARGFICGSRPRRQKCVGCGRPASLQCDWKVPTRKSGTCDAYLCAACAHEPAPDKHLCPTHTLAWQEFPGARIGGAGG